MHRVPQRTGPWQQSTSMLDKRERLRAYGGVVLRSQACRLWLAEIDRHGIRPAASQGGGGGWWQED
jgi:hypothetical protein